MIWILVGAEDDRASVAMWRSTDGGRTFADATGHALGQSFIRRTKIAQLDERDDPLSG